LVGIPLYVLPLPESPFILLNILSFLALLLLGWYCLKHFPEIPKWFIWGWVFTAPWVMNFSTHVVNPSYVLFGAVIFFVGIFELIPPLSKNVIPPGLAMAMVGFGLFWIFQLHMSWIIITPHILLVLYLQLKDKRKKFLKLILCFMGGSLSTGIFVLPTYIKYGFIQGSGGTGANVQFEMKNLLNIFAVIARFLSFASFEIARFAGAGTVSRLAFLKEYFWVTPFIVFAAIIGFAQVVIMLIKLFKKEREKSWKLLKSLTGGTIFLVYLGSIFSIKGPSAHTFYLMLPLAMFYFFYAFKDYLKASLWKKIAVALFVSGLIVHIGLAIRNYKERSLYKNREIVVKAIQKKDFTILGERRKTKSGIGY